MTILLGGKPDFCSSKGLGLKEVRIAPCLHICPATIEPSRCHPKGRNEVKHPVRTGLTVGRFNRTTLSQRQGALFFLSAKVSLLACASKQAPKEHRIDPKFWNLCMRLFTFKRPSRILRRVHARLRCRPGTGAARGSHAKSKTTFEKELKRWLREEDSSSIRFTISCPMFRPRTSRPCIAPLLSTPATDSAVRRWLPGGSCGSRKRYPAE